MIGITPGFEAMAKSLVLSLAESGPVSVEEFDDAWTPAGDTYRDELITAGLVTIEEPTEEQGGHPMLVLTGAGVTLAQEEQA